MGVGHATSLAGKVNAPTQVVEKVVGANTIRLFQVKTPCSRLWLGAPTAKHKRIGPNTDYLLVGPGRVNITLTGQPADGDTISLSDGINTYVFEFDNNSAVTGGNILVTIGSNSLNTMVNLVAAINANLPLYGNNPPASNTSTVATVLGIAAIASVGANITPGNINDQGSTPIAVDNLIGYWEPTEDASLLFITGFAASDAVEVRVYG